MSTDESASKSYSRTNPAISIPNSSDKNFFTEIAAPPRSENARYRPDGVRELRCNFRNIANSRSASDLRPNFRYTNAS